MAARPLQQTGDVPNWTNLPVLNSLRAGTQICFATDEWFAVADNLNKEEPIEFDENAFDEHGKVMDGWETRRKRTAGHDWCLMKLGLAGVIKGLEVDTAFFTGNQVPRISIQGACLPGDLPLPPWNAKPRKGTAASPEEVKAAEAVGSDTWHTILPMTPLNPGYFDCCKHFFPVDSAQRWTHIRVNYWPDGGVSRLKCYGEVSKDWSGWLASNPESGKELVDLVAAENGGLGLQASNSHYGRPQNLLNMGRGVNMGDGWETARNPKRPPVFKVNAEGMMELPGCDWCILQLGTPGTAAVLEVDTLHFKGNYPESCLVEGCYAPQAPFNPNNAQWVPLLRRTRLTANAIHKFDASSGLQTPPSPISHLRLTIFPDGGVSRVRLWGRPAPQLSKI